MQKERRIKRRGLLLSWTVLVCGLFVTAGTTYLLRQNFSFKNQQRFREATSRIDEAIQSRMEAYISLLRGGAGLFAASQFITHEEFQRFYQRLQIEKNYPGLQGFGYSVRFSSNRLADVEQSIRRQGMTNFTVWPPDIRPEYHSIVFLEPQDDRNRKAIGFDMFTEPLRRAAMTKARDTGEPAASGKVVLVQETSGAPRPGFLIYMPVYMGGGIPETVDERQERLQGFIYCPFRAADVFRKIVPQQRPSGVAFRIFDGRTTSPEALLYEDRVPPDVPRHREQRELNVAGRTWTIEYASTPEFAGVESAGFTWVPAILGVIGSFLLFYFTRGETQARIRAEQGARELFQQREWLQVTLSSIGDAVITTDLAGRVQFLNAVAQNLTGWPESDAKGRMLEEVFPLIQEETRQPLVPPASRVLETGLEVGLPNHTVLLSRDGKERCIDDSAAPIRDREGKLAGVVLVFREISERRQYERRITAQHAVTTILAESPALESAAGRLLEAICENLKFDLGVFWVFNESLNRSEVYRTWHLPGEPLEAFDQACHAFKPGPGEGLPGQVQASRKPKWVVKFDEYSRGEKARQCGLQSAFALPITTEEATFGVLEFFSREAEKPDQELITIAQGLGAQIGQFLQRKKAEEALQRSEELYRAISDTAADGILTIDEASRIITVNPAIERIFGYRAEELIGATLHMLIPERMRQGHDLGMRRFIQTGQRKIPWNGVELPGLHKNGQEIPLELSFGMSRRGDRFLFTGLIRDVSRRKEAEQQLREAEERFSLLVRQAEEYAIITMDSTGRISTWNAGAQRIFSYSAEEILGQESNAFFTEEDRKAGVPEQQLAAAAAEGQVLDERWQVRRDGSRFWASGSLICLKAANGSVRGYAKILRDITERKRAEEAIRELNQELESRVQRRTSALQESKEQMEAFTYTVAHDLRAPLRAMQGFSHALKEDYAGKLESEGQDYLNRIMYAAQKMDALIQDLLAYSRLSRSDMNFSSIGVRELVNSALAAAEHDIEQSKAEIKTSLEDVYLKAHPATIEHAVVNLISNALKFTAPDVRPSIHIRAIDQGEFIQISVQDNGIGIAAEHHDRIFRVFERLHGQESYPGTGIGLAIVRKGVERMGGRVGLASEPGEGSLFWIELPKASAPENSSSPES